MDRAYLNFSRLHMMNQIGSYFVLRAKSNTKYQRIYSRKMDRSTGVVCDQTVKLRGTTNSANYPDTLRRIKSFYGVSENAVQSQLSIAVSVYVLCAIIKKRLHLEQTLYKFLQILGLILFEKTTLFQLLSQTYYTIEPTESSNQLILLN